MKVALVHELLTMRGGAERVFKIFADMFPEAPIYTLLYDEKKLGDWFPKERVIVSSVGQKARSTNHHLYIPKFAKAVEEWDFSEYDVVLSSSSAFVHGLLTNGKPKHICYVHSPARYLWDRTHDVLARARLGFWGPLRHWHISRLFHKLRVWNAESSARPDVLIAVSKEVQRRIQLYWRRESTLIHPPIEDPWFDAPLNNGERSGYLIVATLVPYKKIERAVEAFNRLQLPLTIIGDGPSRKSLEAMSGPSISFKGYLSEEELKKEYANAKALVIPGNEDFGLAPIEAMACGTPVISLRKGGPLETILEGETGEFFDEENSSSLEEAVKKFEQKMYSSEVCRKRAEDFKKKEFMKKIQNVISATL